MSDQLKGFIVGTLLAIGFYGVQSLFAASDAQAQTDWEACRPRGNEITIGRLENGHIQCERHERVGYGMACPVTQKCDFVSVD